MEINSLNNSFNPTQLQDAVAVEVMKKSRDVVEDVVGKILEDNFENTMKIQQEAAAVTGVGGNLNIQG
ncbi:MAG: YjfB family protein [Nautiliaceae bacterium]